MSIDVDPDSERSAQAASLSAIEIELDLVRGGNTDPGASLDRLLELVQEKMRAAACSVFLLEPDRQTLVLATTRGLNPDMQGQVRLNVQEGLVGMVAQSLTTFSAKNASNHPRFKHFDGLDEEKFGSFLAAPVLDRGVFQGVLTVHSEESREFTASDKEYLENVAKRFGSTIHAARNQNNSLRLCINGSGNWLEICGGVGMSIPQTFFGNSTRYVGEN